MKPFDFEAAKRGEAVQTVDGRYVRIERTDMDMPGHPVLAFVYGEGERLAMPVLYSDEGVPCGWDGDKEAPELLCLRMCDTPVERRAFALFYRRSPFNFGMPSENRFAGMHLYATRKEAEADARLTGDAEELIGVAEIRWRENGAAGAYPNPFSV